MVLLQTKYTLIPHHAMPQILYTSVYFKYHVDIIFIRVSTVATVWRWLDYFKNSHSTILSFSICRNVALAIIGLKNWLHAMCSVSKDKYTKMRLTPMRKLIKKMPGKKYTNLKRYHCFSFSSR